MVVDGFSCLQVEGEAAARAVEGEWLLYLLFQYLSSSGAFGAALQLLPPDVSHKDEPRIHFMPFISSKPQRG